MSETCAGSGPKPRPRWASARAAGVFSRSSTVDVRHPRAPPTLRGGAHRAYTATRRDTCPEGGLTAACHGRVAPGEPESPPFAVRGPRSPRLAEDGPETPRFAVRKPDSPRLAVGGSESPVLAIGGSEFLGRHTRGRTALRGPRRHGPEPCPHAPRWRAGHHRTTSGRPGTGLMLHDQSGRLPSPCGGPSHTRPVGPPEGGAPGHRRTTSRRPYTGLYAHHGRERLPGSPGVRAPHDRA